MKKPKISMALIKEEIGYSAYATIQQQHITTQAESFEQIKTNAIEAINFTFEPKGHIYTIEEINFTFDLASFFDFYKVINASALSKRLHMPQSLLAQYIKGIKKPSQAQTQRILKGVQQVGRELAEINIM